MMEPIEVDRHTVDRIRDCLEYLLATQTGPYLDAADVLRTMFPPKAVPSVCGTCGTEVMHEENVGYCCRTTDANGS